MFQTEKKWISIKFPGAINFCLNSIQFSYSLYESESHSVVSDSLRPQELYSPWNSPGQNTGVGSLSLLQEVFPSQGSNPGLPHCRQILHHMSHQGSPFYTWYCIYANVTFSIRPTLSFPSCVHKSTFYVCISTPALQTGSSVPHP